ALITTGQAEDRRGQHVRRLGRPDSSSELISRSTTGVTVGLMGAGFRKRVVETPRWGDQTDKNHSRMWPLVRIRAFRYQMRRKRSGAIFELAHLSQQMVLISRSVSSHRRAGNKTER